MRESGVVWCSRTVAPVPKAPNGPAVGERYSADALIAPGTVSIWVGRFGDEDALDDYVTFRYPSDEGWSPFTRDHGLDWIDEDFAEADPAAICSLSRARPPSRQTMSTSS